MAWHGMAWHGMARHAHQVTCDEGGWGTGAVLVLHSLKSELAFLCGDAFFLARPQPADEKQPCQKNRVR